VSFYKISAGFRNFEVVDIAINERNWWDPVPAVPGWYLIETNTPINVLAKLPQPPNGTNLYSIPDRVEFSQFLRDQGLSIEPREEGAPYIVYAGEHANLKSRAREHSHGNHGTGCLCLSEYNALINYHWNFYFLTCNSVFPEADGDKALRTMIEQVWRGVNGWPLLCKQ